MNSFIQTSKKQDRYLKWVKMESYSNLVTKYMSTTSLEEIDSAYQKASRRVFQENPDLFKQDKEEFDKQVLAAAGSELEKLAAETVKE